MYDAAPALEKSSPRRSSSSKTTANPSKIFILQRVNVLLMIALVVISLASVNSLPDGYQHRRTIRLCSKSLSDALYLVCHGRGGYNGPFSYNGEEETRISSGPGLVEECCYNPCSYEQLEQYCKPLKHDNGNDNSQHGIEESLRIVNLPFTSTRERPTERRTVTSEDNDNGDNKSKDRNVTVLKRPSRGMKMRKHAVRGFKGEKSLRKAAGMRRSSRAGHSNVGLASRRENYIASENYARINLTPRHAYRRHRRPKRPHTGKDLHEATMANVRQFKVGTTVPEPRDSILIFPSKTNLALEPPANDFDESIY